MDRLAKSLFLIAGNKMSLKILSTVDNHISGIKASKYWDEK
jgi:hypothetical protein